MGLTYAIGDVHGCIDQLEELMAHLWDDGMNLEEDTLVFLGDYIDRGPDCKGVIDYVIHLQEMYGKEHVVALKGNHEDMCLHAYKKYGKDSSNEMAACWIYNGGIETKKSYRQWELRHEQEEEVSEEHLNWMLELPTMYENEIGYFVHAGFEPWNKTAEETDDYHRMWIRQDFILNPKDFGKMVYFGHTAQKGNVLDKPEKIGLDTACVYGYKLSAICCDTGKVFQVDGWTKKITIGDE